jgi:ATP-dependent Clp protease protease subunit
MSNYYTIPYVYERDGRGERSWDIYSRLLKDRIIFIGVTIDDAVANAVIAQMLFLQMEDPKKDIHLYINSAGGSNTAGMAIYDTMQFLPCDVVTYCVGQASGVACILLAAGKKGKRYGLPNCRIMMHQPIGGATGQSTDIAIAAKEALRWREVLSEVLAKHSGKTAEQLRKDTDRSYYMSASEAKTYGIVDQVIETAPAGSPAAAVVSGGSYSGGSSSASSSSAPAPQAG